MKTSALIWAALAIGVAAIPARAADDTVIARLAMCQDSWADWNKSNPVQMKAYIDHIRAGFTPHGNDPYFLPKGNTSVFGLHVTQIFPQSIGMGVGFSLNVATPFDKVRPIVEKILGKKLGKCEASDNMRSCEVEIAPERTFTVLAGDPPDNNGTLIGCYYFYEK
jgi:hypothetical protein